MKILLLLIPLLVAPAFAEPLSNKTGFKTSFDVVIDGSTFVIDAISNFDIRSVSFEDGNLVFDINSSIENNFGEMQIPQNVTKGELRFYLDDQEIAAKVLQNDKISFVTLEFAGNGTHTLEVTSDYVPTSEPLVSPVEETPEEKFDQITTVVAVASIVATAGVGSTIAFYVKRRTRPL